VRPPRRQGYDLDALRDADYSAEELNQAGYSAQELKEAGTSLVQLKVAGTPMAKLKQAGYSTLRLKTQQYTTAELAFGARNRVDLRSLGAWYEPIRPWYEKADPPPGLFGKTESESSSDQEINFEIFCELMRAREGSKTLSLSVLRQRFAKLDIDGGGTVSHSEFEAGIILDALSQNDPMKLIAAMDTDGNQAIDQSEFARAVRLTKGCQAVADTSIVLAFNALDQVRRARGTTMMIGGRGEGPSPARLSTSSSPSLAAPSPLTTQPRSQTPFVRRTARASSIGQSFEPSFSPRSSAHRPRSFESSR
jgi:Ca2+-binding EF-hand superfamily protein